MDTITLEKLRAKREEVEKLWQVAHAARVAAAKVEREFKEMRFEYHFQHESQKE